MTISLRDGDGVKHGEEEGPAREESPLAESVYLEDRLSSIQKAELLSGAFTKEIDNS